MRKSDYILIVIMIFLFGCRNSDVYELGISGAESDFLTLEAENDLTPGTLHEEITGNTSEPRKTPTGTPKPVATRRVTSKTQEPSYPSLYADQNYNCREGPDIAYKHVADISSGSSYRIIARASNGWYAIAINFSYTSHKYCWIGGGVITGDISDLQVVQVPSVSSNSPSGGSSGNSTVNVTLYCLRNNNLRQCGTFTGICAELTHSGPYTLNDYAVWLYSSSPEPMYFYDYDARQVCSAEFP